MQYQMEMMKNLSGLSVEKYAKMDPMQKSFVSNAAPALHKELESGLKRHVPGYGETLTEEGAKKFLEYKTQNDKSLEGLNRVLDISAKGSKASPTDIARASTAVDMLLGPLKHHMGFKTMTEGDLRFLHGMVGNPLKVFSYGPVERTKLQEIIHALENGESAEAKAVGLKPKIGEEARNAQRREFLISKPVFK